MDEEKGTSDVRARHDFYDHWGEWGERDTYYSRWGRGDSRTLDEVREELVIKSRRRREEEKERERQEMARTTYGRYGSRSNPYEFDDDFFTSTEEDSSREESEETTIGVDQMVRLRNDIDRLMRRVDNVRDDSSQNIREMRDDLNKTRDANRRLTQQNKDLRIANDKLNQRVEAIETVLAQILEENHGMIDAQKSSIEQRDPLAMINEGLMF